MQTGNAEKPRLGYSGGGPIRCMAEGGLVEKIKAALQPKPAAQAPLGAGAAAQARTTIQSRPQTIDDAETKAVGKAKGGTIPGKSPSDTADNIPIMATAGEFMVKKAAVDKLGVKTLEALNSVADSDGEAPTMVPKLGKIKRKRSRAAKRKFAQGGLIDDEQQRLANQTATYVRGAQANAASRAPEPAAPAPAPAPTAQPGGAVFGLYPQLRNGAPAQTYATDAKLSQGITADGQAALPPTPAPPIVGGGSGQRMTGVTPPVAPAPPPAPGAAVAAPLPPPVAVAPPASAVAPPAAPAATAPGAGFVTAGQVTRVGNSYSGSNVAGDVNFVGGNGQALPARGGFVRGTGDGTFKYGGGNSGVTADNLGGNDQILHEARKAAMARGDTAAVTASYASQGQSFGAKTDPIDALINNGRPMTARKAAAIAQLQSARAQADGSTAATKLAGDKFAVEKEGAELTNREKKGLLSAQDAYANAKTEPDRAKALETIQGLTGKTPKELPNRYTPFLQPDQLGPDGLTVMKGGQGVLDNQTGQVVNVQAQATALPPGLKVGAPSKQADGVYNAAGKTVTIKGGKVTEIK